MNDLERFDYPLDPQEEQQCLDLLTGFVRTRFGAPAQANTVQQYEEMRGDGNYVKLHVVTYGDDFNELYQQVFCRIGTPPELVDPSDSDDDTEGMEQRIRLKFIELTADGKEQTITVNHALGMVVVNYCGELDVEITEYTDPDNPDPIRSNGSLMFSDLLTVVGFCTALN